MLALTTFIAGLILWQTQDHTQRMLLDLTRAQARVFLIGVEREIQQQAPDLEPRRLQTIVDRAVIYEMENLDFSIHHLLIVNRAGEAHAGPTGSSMPLES